MNVFRNRLMQMLVDLGVLGVSFGVAYLIRFDWQPELAHLKRLLFQWPYVLLLELVIFYWLGVHRLIWRYISLRDAMRLAYGVGVSTAILIAARLIAGQVEWAYAQYASVPLSIIAINFLLVVSGVVGVRVLRRLQFERSEIRAQQHDIDPQRVLLVGAGRSGQTVAKEITGRAELGMMAVAFLDDDPLKIGTKILGLEVLGPTKNLPGVVERLDVDQVVIAITRASGVEVRRLVGLCASAGVPAKILPGLSEILGGQVSVSRIREVQIEDLLGRDPIALDLEAIASFLRRKVVMITGAGGSIGSEICRQVAGFDPARIVLVERAENAMFEIYSELKRNHSQISIEPAIADVGDVARMRTVFATSACDVVFHAAAHKHVPLMENNAGEAIKNNVMGTQCVADLACAFGVGYFVFISTDKAINPTSVMGASKRVAELYLQSKAAKGASTKFIAVRFGNVLGSNGSVVPIFRRQIAEGGPVTVTHPDMRRYFMTIPEATQLVLQAASMGEGGEVFILDMGNPVSILTLARDMIRLSGLEPNRDIEIRFTGMRPGEKMFEELSTGSEGTQKTRHHKIFIGKVGSANWEDLQAAMEKFQVCANNMDSCDIYHALRALLPEFCSAQGKASGSIVPGPIKNIHVT